MDHQQPFVNLDLQTPTDFQTIQDDQQVLWNIIEDIEQNEDYSDDEEICEESCQKDPLENKIFMMEGGQPVRSSKYS